MKYKKELNDFEKACGLNHSQVQRIKMMLEKAYNQHWHPDGPNIDQINAFIAPFLHTPEEAFYAAQIIMTDMMGQIMIAKGLKL